MVKIKLDKRFSIEADKWSWNLVETIPGKKKDRREVTYYPNLAALCLVAIDRQAGDCETLEEIRTLLVKIYDGLKGIKREEIGSAEAALVERGTMWVNGEGFKVSKRYLKIVGGGLVESDDHDAPIDKWDKCEEIG